MTDRHRAGIDVDDRSIPISCRLSRNGLYAADAVLGANSIGVLCLKL